MVGDGIAVALNSGFYFTDNYYFNYYYIDVNETEFSFIPFLYNIY